uniref:Ras-associating domain-containing protein n=1 Tax=Macrostomum lignano TaxID=282301 RepID=A0A1I8FJS7_9PLAT
FSHAACSRDSWPVAARYYLDGDSLGHASAKPSQLCASSFWSDERLELALATHSRRDSALLRPGAGLRSPAATAVIELRTESGRLVVMVTTPRARPAKLGNVIRLSSRDRIDEWQRAKASFRRALHRHQSPAWPSTATSRWTSRFFGNSSRAVNSSRDSLLSRFVKVGGDSLLELPLGPGSLSKLGDAHSQRKNLTVFFHNGILSLGQEYINNDKVVQDVLSQFIGMKRVQVLQSYLPVQPGRGQPGAERQIRRNRAMIKPEH